MSVRSLSHLCDMTSVLHAHFIGPCIVACSTRDPSHTFMQKPGCFSLLKGSSAALRDNRPSIEGYTIKENEFCAESTYNNNLTTIAEAVSRCSDDPNCAAVEDRWGNERPPLGLCKKFKGKRSGAGTYLLRRGIHKLEKNK